VPSDEGPDARLPLTVGLLTSLEELDEVMAVEAECFTNPWTRAMHVADLANADVSRVVVARDVQNALVGFCSFWRLLDELHINNLAVRPAWRRRGVARAILDRVFAEAYSMGARRATLEVRRSNEPARRLYEQLGFGLASVRRDYYTAPQEDALVLWREGLPGQGGDPTGGSNLETT
jgi:ribosomal-protein-alanine N-acetyltransferase